MQTALFLVDSPFQVLVATEYAVAEDLLANAELILFPTVKGPLRFDANVPLAQMKHVASLAPWGSVTSMPTELGTVGRRMRRKLTVARQLFHHRSVDRLVVGDIQKSYDLYLAALRPRRVVLLDDGLRTLQFEQNARKFNALDPWPLRRRMLGGGFDFLDPNSAFEIFTFTKVPGELRATANTFAWTSALITHQDIVDEAWIVGQPVVEYGLMSEDRYVAALCGQCRTSDRLERKYFVHHRETYEAAASRAEALGATVQDRRYPVELEAVVGQRAPRLVVGLTSTALVTMRFLLPEECDVRAANLPEEDLVDVPIKGPFVLAQAYVGQELEADRVARRAPQVNSGEDGRR